jgi:phosphoglucosamine mutase
MKYRLFGTDGIRGIVNQYPITPDLMVKLGRALTHMLQSEGRKAVRILIGKDTRISGDMIQCAVAAGICSANGEAVLAGVLPTPAISYLTVSGKFDAGIMISASHNPYHDNGVKIFNADGYKLSDAREDRIEALLAEDLSTGIDGSVNGECGPVNRAAEPLQVYMDFLRRALPPDFSLKGLSIILDCSNGATYQVAPRIFTDLGAHVTTLFNQPDGRNINVDCGSQHTGPLQRKVTEQGADVGFAFDGDGDRLIAVDENGVRSTGDQILAVCAQYLKEQHRLENNLAVSTVMSNAGLHQAFKEMGIRLLVTDVGDRYVLEQMRAHGAILGGEDSGHMIFLDAHTSGDGIFSALRLLQIMREKRKPLSDLVSIMTVYPQVLINVAVTRRTDLNDIPDIAEAIETVKHQLGDHGRVLVRYSGTRPLCRVMVEGPDANEIRQYALYLEKVIEKYLQ